MSSANGSRLRLTRSRTARWAMPTASVLVAVATTIAINVLTTNWQWVWWLVLGVLVIANVLVLVRINAADRPPTVSAGGHGSVAAGGNIKGNTTTRAFGSAPGQVPGAGGISAGGAGAVAAGGDIIGDTSTEAG